MNREEIALQLTLKALDKFRVEKASQVAEIFNVVYEALRLPAEERSSAKEQEADSLPEQLKEEPPAVQETPPSGQQGLKKGKRTRK